MFSGEINKWDPEGGLANFVYSVSYRKLFRNYRQFEKFERYRRANDRHMEDSRAYQWILRNPKLRLYSVDWRMEACVLIQSDFS